MRKMVNTFIKHMREAGWDIALNEERGSDIPKVLKGRYTNIPKEWQEFAGNIRHMVSPDEKTWFLGAEDFEVQGDKAFLWNEWELMSLDAAGDDAEWKDGIAQFWSQHLPIVMSVNGGYTYYAISMADGAVVRGAGPEFETCETVAQSFLVFMKNICQSDRITV